jgi:nucleoside-diphosphate-sugar epimerase
VKVLITGGTGFVGQLLARTIQAQGHNVVRAVRQTQPDSVLISTVDGSTSWHEALQGCDSVVHLAARVHVMHDKSTDPVREFRRVNVEGTAHLSAGLCRRRSPFSLPQLRESEWRGDAGRTPLHPR